MRWILEIDGVEGDDLRASTIFFKNFGNFSLGKLETMEEASPKTISKEAIPLD